MSNQLLKVRKGLYFVPQTVAPANPVDGDFYYDSTLGLQLYRLGVWTTAGGGSGDIKVRLVDRVATVLPTVAPLLIDSVTVATGDKVLFTALTVGGGQIYKATVAGIVVSWVAQAEFAGSATPSEADIVRIVNGTVYSKSQFIYQSPNWLWGKIDISNSVLGSTAERWGTLFSNKADLSDSSTAIKLNILNSGTAGQSIFINQSSASNADAAIEVTRSGSSSAPGVKSTAGSSWAFQGISSSASGGVINLKNQNASNILMELYESTGVNSLKIAVQAGLTSHTLKLPNAQGAASTFLQNDGTGILTWAAAAAAGANTALSNLITTNINQTLIPTTGNSLDLGTDLKPWRQTYTHDVYFMVDNAGTTYGTIGYGPTTPAGLGAGSLSMRFLIGDALPIAIYTKSNSLGDVNPTGSVFVETGNKTGGTANSGNIQFQTGTSVGGSRGSVQINALEMNLKAGTPLRMTGSTSGVVGIKPPSAVTSYDVIMPAAQGAGNTFLKNDGSGILSWTAVAADANTFIETMKNQLNDSVYEFLTNNVIALDGVTKVNATPTTATYSSGNGTYQFTKLAYDNFILSAPTEANQWEAVTWAPELGLFVAVAQSGTNRVMTSTDGTTWTAVNVAANLWKQVVWSPELGIFVAIAQSGTGRIMTSPDGSTWTTVTFAPAETITWRGLAWSPQLGLFCATHISGGTQGVMTSPDGVNWTQRTTPNATWTSVVWAPELGLFCACNAAGSLTTATMTSRDGITWTAVAAPVTQTWFDITWSPELLLFVAISNTASSTQGIMTSPDGVVWTQRATPNAKGLITVMWASDLGVFIACGFSGSPRGFYSLNGTTWFDLNSLGSAGTVTEMVWAPELGKLVGVMETGSGANYVSSSAGDRLFSTQNLDADFLDESRDVGGIQLSVKMRTGFVPNTLLASVSRDGGNVYQKVSMARVGSSDTFVGTKEFKDEYKNQTLNTPVASAFAIDLTATTHQSVGQKITITSPSVIKKISFQFNKTGTPDGYMYVSLVRDSGGFPSALSSDIMAVSASILTSSVVTAALRSFTFPNVVLKAGDYHIVISTDASYKATTNGGKFIEIHNNSGTGQAIFDGSVWSPNSSNSLRYFLDGRVLDLRVMIQSPVPTTELSAYGVLYDIMTTGFATSSKLMQRFDFNSTIDNTSSFTLTSFMPDPDLLTVYWIQKGQAFRYGAFSLDGHKIVFPASSFNNGGVSAPMTIVAVQNEGSSFDNSDKNAALMSANHLGSTDTSIDKSIPGMGILLRRPDGTLREVAIDNSDNIVVYSV